MEFASSDDDDDEDHVWSRRMCFSRSLHSWALICFLHLFLSVIIVLVSRIAGYAEQVMGTGVEWHCEAFVDGSWELVSF